MPKDVMTALLTITNPNKDGRTTFSYEDYTVDFDFSRQTFMFATTEGQSIFPPLMDRMERVDLQEYSEDELGKIVRVGMDDYKLTDEAVAEIATTLRGNPLLLPSAATRSLVTVTATRSRCSLLTTGVTSLQEPHSASGLAQQGTGVAPHLVPQVALASPSWRRSLVSPRAASRRTTSYSL